VPNSSKVCSLLAWLFKNYDSFDILMVQLWGHCMRFSPSYVYTEIKKFFPTVCAAPFFEIRHPSVIMYRSCVYERANKKDQHIDMTLSSPVILGGDVMIEFFNRPRMMKKVKRKY